MMKYRMFIFFLLICLVGCNAYVSSDHSELEPSPDIPTPSPTAQESNTNNGQETSVSDTYDAADADNITEPIEVVFDYVEMTNGTGTTPREAVRVGDTFMGMDVVGIHHRDVLFPARWGGEFDGWVKEVSVRLDGELTLPARIEYEKDGDFGHVVWVWLDMEGLALIPKPAYNLHFGRVFRVANSGEVIEILNGESIDAESIVTISSISISYLYFTGGPTNSVIVESFEIID